MNVKVASQPPDSCALSEHANAWGLAIDEGSRRTVQSRSSGVPLCLSPEEGTHSPGNILCRLPTLWCRFRGVVFSEL